MAHHIPVISFIGRSGSGKTTLLEGLIRELKQRGYRLAVVKHHHHKNLIYDIPGKDSERFAQAGADEVVIAGPDQLVRRRRLTQPLTLAEVVAGTHDVDLILTEGYKGEHAPKVQVGWDKGHALLCPSDELVALVTKEAPELPVPRFDPSDVVGLADWIERCFLQRQRER